jgi:peptide/nickel transport system substrate-binding protein
MGISRRILIAAALVCALAMTSVSSSAAAETDDVTLQVLAVSAPETLDPQVAFTANAGEVDWLVYTPLLTYRHVSGTAGGTLIPGLANALPKISPDGTTYEFALRKGLRYSDGQAVKASDFAYSIMRAIKLNWGGKSFFTSNIEGAAAFDAGEAKSISGIVTDDRFGTIKIRLMQPFGAFANLLTFPAAAPVPTGTPMTDLATSPPPGVGPYKIVRVTSDGGYSLRKNPRFPQLHIPGIPIGHADIVKEKIVADNTIEAGRILNNRADVFDIGDEVPPTLLPQIEANASDRFAVQPSASTFFFFLNTTRAPFNNLLARQAVNTALDREKLARFGSGFMKPSCFFIPEGIVGHPTGPCPFGETPDIAKARQMVTDSGMAGTQVTVWGQERQPRREYADYFTDMLNQIGFDASEKIVADAEYFTAIGEAKNDPQTGFGDWFQDFPNPSDFYFLMDGRTIQPTNNQNLSKVNDPFIQEQLIPLNQVPSTELESVAGQWRALDEYVAEQAYVAAFGEQLVPQFYSKRIDFDQAVFHVLFGHDFSTLQVK